MAVNTKQNDDYEVSDSSSDGEVLGKTEAKQNLVAQPQEGDLGETESGIPNSSSPSSNNTTQQSNPSGVSAKSANTVQNPNKQTSEPQSSTSDTNQEQEDNPEEEPEQEEQQEEQEEEKEERDEKEEDEKEEDEKEEEDKEEEKEEESEESDDKSEEGEDKEAQQEEQTPETENEGNVEQPGENPEAAAEAPVEGAGEGAAGSEATGAAGEGASGVSSGGAGATATEAANEGTKEGALYVAGGLGSQAVEEGAGVVADAGLDLAAGQMAASGAAATTVGATEAAAGAAASGAAATGAAAASAAGGAAAGGGVITFLVSNPIGWVILAIVALGLIIIVLAIVISIMWPRTHTNPKSPAGAATISTTSSYINSKKITLVNPADATKISAGEISQPLLDLSNQLAQNHKLLIQYTTASSTLSATSVGTSSPKINDTYEMDITGVDVIKCTDTKTNTKATEFPVYLSSSYDWAKEIKTGFDDKIICAADYYPTLESKIGASSIAEFPITQLATFGPKIAQEKIIALTSEMLDANKKSGKSVEDVESPLPVTINIDSAYAAQALDQLEDKITQSYGEERLKTEAIGVKSSTEYKGIHVSML